MQLLSRNRPIVGLDIGSSSVKAVELRGAKNGIEVIHAALEPLASDTVVDGAIMDALSVSDSITKIFLEQKIKTKSVATSVSGHSVIVKKIPLPIMSEEELDESIQWEAEQHIPFDISDVNLDYQVLNAASSSNTTEVLLVAVKKDKILNHTNVITQAGKTPVVVDIDAFAIQNAFETSYTPASNATVALLNIGASIMNIIVTKGGTPLFTRDVSAGGNQFTDVLQKELNLSFEEAEQLKKGRSIAGVETTNITSLLQSVSEVLLLEIQKTFDFFRATSIGEHIQRIYVSGGCANVTGFLGLLQNKFSMPVELLNPFKNISVGKEIVSSYLEEISPSMAVAVGLALRSFDN
ncbi:MAG: pilus assembly protein PilM [Acidobacteria bacterium]|nr:MAG: pilus assembly protein PilM [Acidobacteriota bacterium]